MTKEELDTLAHGISYEACCTVIESHCLKVDGIDPVWPRYFDVGKDEVDLEAYDIVAESVKYLEARGLLEHHADNFDWVLLRDEAQ
jgi:hypothetical protein